MTDATATRSDGRRPAAAPTVDWSQRTLESISLAVAGGAFILAALVSMLVFGFESAPISGPGSIGQYAAISSAVIAILAFVFGRYLRRERGSRVTILEIIDVAALSLAHAIVALLTWTLLADILERGFIDAVVFPLPLILLSGAASAMTAYVVFFSSTHMDLSLLALVLAVFLVQGVLASTLTAADPHWWEMNLSALGMTDDLSAAVFNITLIIAGVIITTLARHATVNIPTTNPKGVSRVRTSLIIIGVFLACVGLVPVDEHLWIHNSVATGMAITFGIFVGKLRKWIPEISKTFASVGWIFIGVMVFLAVLFAVGLYTLTAVELVVGLLIFSWIILFLRSAAALQQDSQT